MLRTPLARSRLVAARPSWGSAVAQWQLNRPRRFADTSKPDRVVLPGSESKLAAASVPPPTTSPSSSPTSAPPIVPSLPPDPKKVQSPSVPTGTGTASTGPTPTSAPPAPKKRSRFRSFLTSLLVLSILGYGGGVYYSLVSDNFHDFFTEYVPFGEDSVAYFEEREFRKRFPARPNESKSYPQIRGENKVTIGKQSGLTAKAAGSTQGDDLSKSGRHVSALEDNNKPSEVSKSKSAGPSKQASKSDKGAASEAQKKATQGSQPHEDTPPSGSTASKSKQAPATAAPATAAPATAPAPAPVTTPLVDNLNVPDATEPVVQATVKMLNDLITVINADPNASKYQTTITQAKSQLNDIVGSISTLKSQIKADAEKQVSDAHTQFDTAAKELVSRLEREIQDQELKWREEYESEREHISKSYDAKLSAELQAVQKQAEQYTQTALVEQQIALNREFANKVQARVEEERSGRLGKLDQLSKSVEELSSLTAEWNSVIDTNLRTQHLHVALEAVRSAIAAVDHPTPFVTELSALKEVAANNDVVNAAIASIPPVAYQRGLPTPAHLIDRFRRVAGEVRKASLLPEDAGVASHAASAVLSRFMFSKKPEGMPKGEDVEAVLTRTEVLLEEGDLDGAAREMNGLHGWAGVLSKDWVAECRRVLETKQALDVIATEARLQSLLVD